MTKKEILDEIDYYSRNMTTEDTLIFLYKRNLALIEENNMLKDKLTKINDIVDKFDTRNSIKLEYLKDSITECLDGVGKVRK